MDQSVDGGDGHGFVREDLIPAAEGLVGGDGDAAVFVAPGDQLEEDAGLGLVFMGIGDVIEDDQVEPIQFCQGGLEDEITTGDLKLLHQIAGSGVEDAVPRLDQGMADGTQDVGLAGSGIADRDQVAATLKPVACRQSLDAGMRQGW